MRFGASENVGTLNEFLKNDFLRIDNVVEAILEEIEDRTLGDVDIEQVAPPAYVCVCNATGINIKIK